METRIDFLQWLYKKVYLNRMILFITIGIVITLPIVFIKFLQFQPLAALFASSLIVYLLREVYETLVIYEVPIRDISIPKITTLVCANTFITTAVYLFIQPSIGHFAVPAAVMISARVIKILKEQLWQETIQPGFFAELPAKLEAVPRGTLIFIAILVGITYMAYAKHGFNFYYAFAAAFFIGMIVEESYNVINVYAQKVTASSIIPMILWSACCAIVSSAIVFVMMQVFGYAGQPATITSVILVKLIQPWGAGRFIYRFGKQ